MLWWFALLIFSLFGWRAVHKARKRQERIWQEWHEAQLRSLPEPSSPAHVMHPVDQRAILFPPQPGVN
jgi:hypothetical protein